MVLSADTTNDPDVAGINGASVALSVSDIPFHGPIGAVRVGRVDGEFVVNPTYDEQRAGNLNLMVVGTADGIVMIESGARRSLGRDRGAGHRVRPRADQEDLRCHQRTAKKVGKPKRAVEPPVVDEAYLDELRTKYGRSPGGRSRTPRSIPRTKATA